MMDRRKTPVRSGQQKIWSLRPCRSMRLVTAFLLAFLISSCAGGSGSSGFDISPSAENDAINQALVSRECVPGEELTVCPANQTSLDVPAPGFPTGPANVDVSTIVDPEGATLCGNTPTGDCRIMVTVNVSGLPPDSAYQVAGRSATPLTPWVIDDEATVLTGNGVTTFTATVAVPSTSLSLQVAVLVFIERSGTATGEIRTLTETGADLAFVTTPVTIPR
jgi:hypothetical protein